MAEATRKGVYWGVVVGGRRFVGGREGGRGRKGREVLSLVKVLVVMMVGEVGWCTCMCGRSWGWCGGWEGVGGSGKV